MYTASHQHDTSLLPYLYNLQCMDSSSAVRVWIWTSRNCRCFWCIGSICYVSYGVTKGICSRMAVERKAFPGAKHASPQAFLPSLLSQHNPLMMACMPHFVSICCFAWCPTQTCVSIILLQRQASAYSLSVHWPTTMCTYLYAVKPCQTFCSSDGSPMQKWDCCQHGTEAVTKSVQKVVLNAEQRFTWDRRHVRQRQLVAGQVRQQGCRE